MRHPYREEEVARRAFGRGHGHCSQGEQGAHLVRVEGAKEGPGGFYELDVYRLGEALLAGT